MLDIFLYVLGFIITLGFVFWSVSIYYSKDGVVIFDKNHPMFWYRYIMTTPVSISDVLVSRLLCTDVYREYSLNLNDNYFDRQPVNLVNAFKIIHILTLQSIRESRSLCGNFWHDILFLMIITPLVITLSILSLPLHIFFYIIKYTFIGISLLLFIIFVPIKDLIINSISSSNKYLRTNLKKFKEINKAKHKYLMQTNTRSLLEELESISHNRDTTHIIESRANNIITSAINLLELMNKHYTEEQCQILERKLLGAIKSRDQSRFAKSLRKNSETE
jgi:hypothetical protein